MLSFFYTVLVIIRSIVQEKESRMKVVAKEGAGPDVACWAEDRTRDESYSFCLSVIVVDLKNLQSAIISKLKVLVNFKFS